MELANQNLDATGYSKRDGNGVRLDPNGQRISINLRFSIEGYPYADVVELLQAYWSAVGIEVRTQPQDRSLWAERQAANEFDITIYAGQSVDYDSMVLATTTRLVPGIDDWINAGRPWYDWRVSQLRGPRRSPQRHHRGCMARFCRGQVAGRGQGEPVGNFHPIWLDWLWMDASAELIMIHEYGNESPTG